MKLLSRHRRFSSATRPATSWAAWPGVFRKLPQQGGFSINKEKVTEINEPATQSLLLNDKYILVQKGKKNYFLLIAK